MDVVEVAAATGAALIFLAGVLGIGAFLLAADPPLRHAGRAATRRPRCVSSRRRTGAVGCCVHCSALAAALALGPVSASMTSDEEDEIIAMLGSVAALGDDGDAAAPMRSTRPEPPSPYPAAPA